MVILIKPEKGEVGDSDGLPVVLHLFSSAVDDVGDLVSHYKLQVLD